MGECGQPDRTGGPGESLSTTSCSRGRNIIWTEILRKSLRFRSLKSSANRTLARGKRRNRVVSGGTPSPTRDDDRPNVPEGSSGPVGSPVASARGYRPRVGPAGRRGDGGGREEGWASAAFVGVFE